MKIAILGWGSLLWDCSEEFDRWHDAWQKDGPTVKLEFSRISARRSGALTLVIDEEHGSPVTVAWCCSKRTQLEDAMCDLRCREGTSVANIGRLGPTAPGERSNNSVTETSLSDWARQKELGDVVWTALRSNFAGRSPDHQPFSVDNALAYLKNLPPEGKSKAAEYVWRAPPFVKTPLRSALEKEPWF